VLGLRLSAVPERESTCDAFLSNHFATLADLSPGAKVGTGSLRRRSQLLHVRPDLEVLDIRGNVDTRLRKLDDGEYDAIILAEAGLKRLGLAERIRHVVPADVMLPAVAQGALGIETRADDMLTQTAVSVLNHAPTHASVVAERSMLAALRGGCLAPVGALAVCCDTQLTLQAVVLNLSGSEKINAAQTGPIEQAIQIGADVAQKLLDLGAEKLIASSRTR
jgi:hydroxymethylbilane synthase